jgi:hypothetical protein
MVLKGHCLCKAVTYTVDVDQPLITGYDHCDDCQRQSGSTYCKLYTFSTSLRLPPPTRRVFPGPLYQARSGNGACELVVATAGRKTVGPQPRNSQRCGCREALSRSRVLSKPKGLRPTVRTLQRAPSPLTCGGPRAEIDT